MVDKGLWGLIGLGVFVWIFYSAESLWRGDGILLRNHCLGDKTIVPSETSLAEMGRGRWPVGRAGLVAVPSFSRTFRACLVGSWYSEATARFAVIFLKLLPVGEDQNEQMTHF